MFLSNILQAPDIKIQQNIIDDIMSAVADKIDKKQNWTINIVFISSDEIQNYNKKYREKDQSTDVLSFHYYDDFSELDDDEVAWEVLLCLDKIGPDAEKNNVSPAEQSYMLIIHSLLHILWHDHLGDDDYKIMHTLEKSIYSEVFWKDFN